MNVALDRISGLECDMAGVCSGGVGLGIGTLGCDFGRSELGN